MATVTITPKTLSRRRQPAAPAILGKVAQVNTYVGAYVDLLDRRPRPARAPVAPVLHLSAAGRAQIEALVFRQIDLLDAATPEADAEPDFDAEAEADEASLQPVTLAPAWARPVMLRRAEQGFRA